MLARSTTKVFVLCALVLTPVACDTTGTTNRSGFKNGYQVARNALEAGRYDKASRAYAKLVDNAGPLENRVRLEYAHSLLREGRYLDASNQARAVANSEKGASRSAALSVQGSADHEYARSVLALGQDRDVAKSRLKSAKAALDEMLKKNKELDPLGTMVKRRKAIKVELAALG
ncbi:MAG: hypothetical protein GY947_13490 [Rhodobacteraceae bacterium]|nr:hypothetical protein [Paracoccaceae bacterium]